MARWVALFRDDPSADWVRKKHDKEHFDYLAAHSDKIKIDGGLRPSPDEWFCGGFGSSRFQTGRKQSAWSKKIRISSSA